MIAEERLEDDKQRRGFLSRLKYRCAELIGRERANRLSSPYHDWVARRHTSQRLSSLPGTGLCINLGCGYHPFPGWVNVDIARGPQVDIVWDLRRGLPFHDGSCSAIFSEHVIEHLSREDGELLLRECYRALQQGGVLRVSTPDAGRYLRSYAGDGEFLRHSSFSEPMTTPLDRINQMMREYGQHLWVYDTDSLQFVLRQVGFARTVEQSFGRSIHPRMHGIDSESREFESLYVEAVK
jgi:predicted SAM-dependent methyltransferase